MCYNEFTESALIKWVRLLKSETVERLSNDEHIIGLYNAELEEEIMRNTIRDYNKELGFKEGREKGLEKGIEQTQKQVAINMLKDNLDINLISKYTNLSVEEINEIKKDIEDDCN